MDTGLGSGASIATRAHIYIDILSVLVLVVVGCFLFSPGEGKQTHDLTAARNFVPPLTSLSSLPGRTHLFPGHTFLEGTRD